eukprot:gnl/TRDRNA2_/TRDRNA2_31705_c0_seq1.p1 gnl/TRDRNA2_/TRDRNA2_31705_c0~~gnl/TRDRNA2_/TRDRNA2_31705_c0_seq1.p1  ORF type:complete len:312 (-),score=37.74 gnl/TRDRNA2_/TRDRNA2_31705_c0_seq1:64-999(-)
MGQEEDQSLSTRDSTTSSQTPQPGGSADTELMMDELSEIDEALRVQSELMGNALMHMIQVTKLANQGQAQLRSSQTVMHVIRDSATAKGPPSTRGVALEPSLSEGAASSSSQESRGLHAASGDVQSGGYLQEVWDIRRESAPTRTSLSSSQLRHLPHYHQQQPPQQHADGVALTPRRQVPRDPPMPKRMASSNQMWVPQRLIVPTRTSSSNSSSAYAAPQDGSFTGNWMPVPTPQRVHSSQVHVASSSSQVSQPHRQHVPARMPLWSNQVTPKHMAVGSQSQIGNGPWNSQAQEAPQRHTRGSMRQDESDE